MPATARSRPPSPRPSPTPRPRRRRHLSAVGAADPVDHTGSGLGHRRRRPLRHGTRVRPGQGLGQRRAGQQLRQPDAGHEDDGHRDHGDQRPGQVLVEMPPTEPAHDRDEEHLGQVDPVGVVRARLHDGPGPLRSAPVHQRHADQVDAGDGPDVERDHDRLEGIGARAQPRHHVVGRQVVPDLGGDGRRQRARHDEQHVRAEPVVELVEMHGDDHAGHQIELVRGHLARGPVALHPRRHQAPVHGGHEHDLHAGRSRAARDRGGRRSCAAAPGGAGTARRTPAGPAGSRAGSSRCRTGRADGACPPSASRARSGRPTRK